MFSDFWKSEFPDFGMLLKFQYLNHFLKIRCCRKGSRRHGAPLKSRTLSPIHFLLQNSLFFLNTIRSGISSVAAHLPFLLCVPTFALPEPQSALWFRTMRQAPNIDVGCLSHCREPQCRLWFWQGKCGDTS